MPTAAGHPQKDVQIVNLHGFHDSSPCVSAAHESCLVFGLELEGAANNSRMSLPVICCSQLLPPPIQRLSPDSVLAKHKPKVEPNLPHQTSTHLLHHLLSMCNVWTIFVYYTK